MTSQPNSGETPRNGAITANHAPDRPAGDPGNDQVTLEMDALRRTIGHLQDLAQKAQQPEAPDIGPYELLYPIGRGGMGVVYAARDTRDDRSVAIKLVGDSRVAGDVAIQRFQREAETMQRLRHPHIAMVFEAGKHESLRYLAMEYVRGVSLSQVLRELRKQPLPSLGEYRVLDLVRDLSPEIDGAIHDGIEPFPRNYYAGAAKIVRDIAVALAYVHKSQVVHRDVKPDNIMLRPDGTAVLTDFGLARSANDATVTRTADFIGTPAYASRAVARGAQPTPSDDIYSLGATLYELVGLDRAFPGSASKALGDVRRFPPRSLRERNPHAPADLIAIVECAMQPNAEARYGTAQEMADDLFRFLRGLPVKARSATWKTRTARFVRWHPVATGLLSIAATTLLVSTAAASVASIAKDREFWRLVASARSKDQQGQFVAAAADFSRALELQANPAVQREYHHAAGFRPVVLRGMPENTSVEVFSLDEFSGAIARAQEIFTQIDGGEWTLQLPVGEYRVVVNQAGFGFGEYHVVVLRESEVVELDIDLRPTERVREGMVAIPAGTYRVGRRRAEVTSPLQRYEQEVSVPGFYIDEHEVSNADYAEFVAEGHPAPEHWEDGMYPAGTADLPVTGVTWFDASQYAEWCGKRLPTEDEWEIAARDSDGRPFPWGSAVDFESINVCPPPGSGPNLIIPVRGKPQPVHLTTRDRNGFGVVHMAGNVREWVWNRWAPRDDAPHPALLPDGRRIVKGGSFGVPANPATVASWGRTPKPPADGDPFTGFRCAKSLPPDD